MGADVDQYTVLTKLELCAQSQVQEMQTTPDTNKSVALFHNKNITDIYSKLMVKHLVCLLDQSAKNHVPHFKCWHLLIVTNAHTKRYVLIVGYSQHAHQRSLKVRGTKFKYLWGLAGNINKSSRKSLGDRNSMTTPRHHGELHKLLLEMSPFTTLFCTVPHHQVLAE